MADRRAQIAGDYADWLAARQAPYSATAAATLRRTEDRLGPSAVRYLLDALAEAEAERERWKEVADAADDVIRAVLAALYRGPDTDPVIRAKKVMAERDALAAKLAAAWDEGFDAGHQSARAVNPEWPAQPSNPYREDRSDALEAGEDA